MATKDDSIKITVALAPETYDCLKIVVARMNRHHDDFSTHGRMTIEGLAEMLLQDVAMIERRSGSWEAAQMSATLVKHGYKVD